MLCSKRGWWKVPESAGSRGRKRAKVLWQRKAISICARWKYLKSFPEGFSACGWTVQKLVHYLKISFRRYKENSSLPNSWPSVEKWPAIFLFFFSFVFSFLIVHRAKIWPPLWFLSCTYLRCVKNLMFILFSVNRRTDMTYMQYYFDLMQESLVYSGRTITWVVTCVNPQSPLPCGNPQHQLWIQFSLQK